MVVIDHRQDSDLERLLVLFVHEHEAPNNNAVEHDLRGHESHALVVKLF